MSFGNLSLVVFGYDVQFVSIAHSRYAFSQLQREALLNTAIMTVSIAHSRYAFSQLGFPEFGAPHLPRFNRSFAICLFATLASCLALPLHGGFNPFFSLILFPTSGRLPLLSSVFLAFSRFFSVCPSTT